MKYLLFLLFIFTATGASAQCMLPAPALPSGPWIIQPNESGYVRVCNQIAGYEAACDNAAGQYWVQHHRAPILTNDTLETCDGLWLPTAEQIRSGTGSNPPSSSGEVVTAIEDSTLVLTTAIACLCFFTGLNSWETSAK